MNFNLPRFNNPLKIKRLTSLKKWPKIKKWIVKIGLGFLLLIFLLFAWYAKDLPTPGNIKKRHAVAATQIFDRNGNELYAVHGDIKRIMVNKNDIPEEVKQATLTAEDRNFYKHFGIDARGIARAIYYDLFKHQRVGGSTITQQFVKNALLDPKKTFTRKIKELILTIEIEIMYSKDDILTMYLNEIPYGSNAYGIEAAAETYFGKNAKDLNLAESATLAALPQAPTYYSPYGIHPDKRQIRVEWILNSMADLGYISHDEAEAAKTEAKNLKFQERHDSISAPHFVMYVKDLLVEKYGEQMVEEGGLKVTTTLDPDKQKAAEEAISNASLSGIHASNAALTSIDPKTGQVLAMVGSRDFFNNDIDGQVNVAIAERQPGSAFKPVVYATAFKKNYGPGHTLWDLTTNFGDYTPRNYDGTTRGPVTMRQALAGSLNIPAVKTLYLAGLDNVLDQAHSMGITTLNDRDRYGLSLVLGGGEIKLLDLVSAYGTFANNGIYLETTPILKVEDNRGKVLDEYNEKKENKKEVLDPQIAYEINSILSDNSARAYVFGSRSALYFDDRPVAAKTGTTTSYRDAWTFGYTPSLVAGVWVGNNDNSEMAAGSAGAMAAAPIWHEYMGKALANTPAEEFNRPSEIKDQTIDRYTNMLPSGGETITDIFTSWQIPQSRSSSTGAIRIDKFTGMRATDDCPSEFVIEKVFSNIHSEQPDNPAWENPVRSWLVEHNMLASAPPEGEKTCAGLTNQTKIEITSPKNGSPVSGKTIIIAQVSSSATINNVEFFIDGNSIGKVSLKPYQIAYNANLLSSGNHTISAVATDNLGLSTSDSITVSVNARDTTAPGPVSLLSISGEEKRISVSWRNPTDSDLASAKIYVSTTSGQIGTANSIVVATPNAISSIAINNLQKETTYYITIHPIDTSGNENTDSTQFEAKTL